MLRKAREWRDDVEGNQQKVDQAIPSLAPLPGSVGETVLSANDPCPKGLRAADMLLDDPYLHHPTSRDSARRAVTAWMAAAKHVEKWRTAGKLSFRARAGFRLVCILSEMFLRTIQDLVRKNDILRTMFRLRGLTVKANVDVHAQIAETRGRRHCCACKTSCGGRRECGLLLGDPVSSRPTCH